MTVFQFDAEHCVGKGLDHRTILLDSYLFGHCQKITLKIDQTIFLNVVESRKLFGPAFPDNNRKLIMCRILVIGRVYCPTIFCKVHTSAACTDHRLNTNGHSVHQAGAVPLSPVVGDAGGLVHFPAQAVSFQFADHGKAE